MTRRLVLNVFVDACGWEVIQPRPWFLPELRHRQSVESIFGYSSACVPAILSGLRPDENDHFCFLRWDPRNSPFTDVDWLAALPRPLARRARVRRALSGWLARRLDLQGYFSLYDLSLERLREVDWTEKKDLFAPGGLNRGESIFDALQQAGVPYHVSDWRIAEAKRFDAAEAALRGGSPAFAFVYAADLDGILHQHGHDTARVDAYLRTLQGRVRRVVSAARRHYDEVEVALFSDHGMAEVRETRDLKSEIDQLGLRWGVDYAAVFDSTMARFWFLSERGERRIRNALGDDSRGSWVTTETMARWGAHWPDGHYGHAFYLLTPGQLLCPSDLGAGRLAGMHGYRPDHADSLATLLSSSAPGQAVSDLTDLNVMMRTRAGLDALERVA